MKIRSVVA